jgi:formamidopyrimidine-DNA glycosylase
MPELPEVETLKRDLAKTIVGKKINRVSVLWPKTVKPLSVNLFIKNVSAKKITAVSRRAKMLVIDLSDGNHLLVHLKMTGQLIFKPKAKNQKLKLIAGGHPQPGGMDNLPNSFTRLIFEFSDGTKLFFNDMRKFGWVRFVTPDDFQKASDNYGIEPLEKDFTFSFFNKVLERYPNRKIKQWLLDQKIISGLGNIYADESCFYAKILPTRIVGTLNQKEKKDLFTHIPKVLKLSISKKGTSFSDYVQLDGKAGQMIKWLKVYNKKNQSCQRCKGKIEKIKLNGRGTHFCPKCQK